MEFNVALGTTSGTGPLTSGHGVSASFWMQVHQTEEERLKKRKREKRKQKEEEETCSSQATSQTKASTPEVSSGRPQEWGNNMSKRGAQLQPCRSKAAATISSHSPKITRKHAICRSRKCRDWWYRDTRGDPMCTHVHQSSVNNHSSHVRITAAKPSHGGRPGEHQGRRRRARSGGRLEGRRPISTGLHPEVQVSQHPQASMQRRR